MAFINKKIEEYTQKAKLKKKPKLKVSKKLAPASVNVTKNELYVSDHLLSHWQKGLFDDREVEALLVHEFGHLIDYSHKSWFEKHLKYSIQWYLAIFPTIFVLGILFLSFMFGVMASFIVPIFGVIGIVWAYYLPWIMRKNFVARELEANKNAIFFKLVEAKQIADFITKSIGVPLPEIVGPVTTWAS
jgi:Zn-dependent protease with chaperone function